MPPDKKTDAHEKPRRDPRAQAMMDRFFRTGELKNFCDGACTANASGASRQTRPASCPLPPTGFAFSPGSCINADRSSCQRGHCDCATEQLDHGNCNSYAACLQAASSSCHAEAACHSFAVQSQANCSSGKMWETYRFGGKSSAVPNSDWSAYTKPGTGPAPPPGPSPHPSPSPSPSFPSIPAHGAVVPTLISGNWSGPTQPLPDSKIPPNPLLGNGYTGILMDGNERHVTLSLNTNGMWPVHTT